MNRMNESIELTRDVEGVQIPTGFTMILQRGTEVTLMQSLGGSYTVMTPQGLARVEGRDADALGFEKEGRAEAVAEIDPTDANQIEGRVWEELRTCFDPEIPVNIVDLGLVYGCSVAAAEEGGFRVGVEFTLTAPGCGMGDWLALDMKSKIEKVPGVKEVEVEVVFDPPWDQSRMSEEAKLELGM